MPTANTYPQIAAGDDITADLLSSMQPRIITKSSSTTRTTTTTVTDDPDLSMALDANSTYIVEFHVYYSAINAEKIKTTWTVPSGVTGSRGVQGAGSNANDSSLDNVLCRNGVHDYTTAVTYGTRNSSVLCHSYEESIVTVGSSSGNVALGWAQATSGSTGTVVANGSWMRVTRIA